MKTVRREGPFAITNAEREDSLISIPAKNEKKHILCHNRSNEVHTKLPLVID
jgi:hypothetical protein